MARTTWACGGGQHAMQEEGVLAPVVGATLGVSSREEGGREKLVLRHIRSR